MSLLSARALMIQGTASNAGKSTIVAGLCRLFARRGLRVLPFKPQNMSNNIAITADGGEIGIAQALQARACMAEPSSDMNPVLLKPTSERGSLVVLQGRARDTVGAMEYLNYKRTLMPHVMESYGRLCARADMVLVEGAGSISEINLRAGDISNMGFATEANVPVVLVADIDRGGALAAITGSWYLLPEGERYLLRGYMMNKFRGDFDVLAPALDVIREHTGLSCFGVIGWIANASKLPAEDSLCEKNQCVGIEQTDDILNELASHIEQCVDVDELANIAGL